MTQADVYTVLKSKPGKWFSPDDMHRALTEQGFVGATKPNVRKSLMLLSKMNDVEKKTGKAYHRGGQPTAAFFRYIGDVSL